MAEPSETGRMQAVRYFGGGECRLVDMPLPRAGPGEMLLKLRCCGLCGTDLFKLETDTIPKGAVLGHELVGTVAAIGAGVSRFELGQRVVVPHHVACGRCSLCRRGSETQCSTFRNNLLEPGGFSEFVLVRRTAVELAAKQLPADLSDGAAIFLEPAACVLRGIRRADLPRGDSAPGDGMTVVILGSGGMGLLHLLVLRALTPSFRVAMSDPIPERRQLAEALGAEAACPPDTLVEAVAELSNGRGADALFDTTGSPVAIEAAMPSTREGGSVVLFAHSKPGALLSLEMNQIFKQERRLIGTYSGSLGEQDRVFELLTSGRLDPTPLISHRFPLRDFQRAVELSRQRKALKILLGPPAKEGDHDAP